MKKIAFISDIHSNIPALEETIIDIKKRGIEDIYCLGDIIGYHSFPNQVIKVLKDEGVISIKGNHDLAITEENFNRENESHFVLWWNYDNLTSENIEYLKQLPESLEINVEDITIKIVHGSPESIEEYIREGSKEIDKYFELMTTDVLICGHTHLPYIHEKDGKFLLNTGSVGKPKIGKPLSSYILLNVDGKNISPEIIRLSYDTDTMIKHLKENGFPEKYAEAIKTGNP